MPIKNSTECTALCAYFAYMRRHVSCHVQISEALAKIQAGEKFDAVSRLLYLSSHG
jgi:hypothetical protein